MYVPVVDKNQRPLMPSTSARARKWIASGKATGFWRKGIFCVRLNVEPSSRNLQPIAVGIDPGSKREAYTIKSKTHDYLNIQAHAVDWVKSHVETRRNMRRSRRFRKTPCRKPRWNRLANKNRLAPSTKARWQWKLRICQWLNKIFPIATFVVEDIKAKSFGGKWGKTFSPLQVGKEWFYWELSRLGEVILRQGHETSELRNKLQLKKSKQKLADTFNAHCVDSWCLAYSVVGASSKPKKQDLLIIIPLRFHRRQLHRLEHAPGNIRSPYGGTMSLGLKRGSIVKHPKFGLSYVGGSSKEKISLHSIETGKRLTQNAKCEDIKFLCYNSWRTRRVFVTCGQTSSAAVVKTANLFSSVQ